jgi:hypothetical protein
LSERLKVLREKNPQQSRSPDLVKIFFKKWKRNENLHRQTFQEFVGINLPCKKLKEILQRERREAWNNAKKTGALEMVTKQLRVWCWIQTQGLVPVKYALYHWDVSPALLLFLTDLTHTRWSKIVIVTVYSMTGSEGYIKWMAMTQGMGEEWHHHFCYKGLGLARSSVVWFGLTQISRRRRINLKKHKT